MEITVVLGVEGFIGNHLLYHLKDKGAYVLGVDMKYPIFEKSKEDEFIVGDLRDFFLLKKLSKKTPMNFISSL